MANYKWQSPYPLIEYGGYTHQFNHSTEKLIFLTAQSINAAEVSLHDSTSVSVNYQVPTGKIFRIINAQKVTEMTEANDLLYYSDAADASTNPVTILEWGHSVPDASLFLSDVPAGKYINCHDATNNRSYKLVGIEMDA